MKHLLSIILLALTALTLASCDESTGKPASSNRPYQVLLVGDRDGILYHELTAPVKGLPQPGLTSTLPPPMTSGAPTLPGRS